MKKKKIIIALSILIIFSVSLWILNNFNELSTFKKRITQNPWQYEMLSNENEIYKIENGLYVFFENGKMIDFDSQNGTIKHGLYELKRDTKGIYRFWSNSENIIVEITLLDNQEIPKDLIITYNTHNEIHGVFKISNENEEKENIVDVTLTKVN